MKIWFDILTPKQYLFFEYFIQKLRKQHKIFCTSRKYEQVNGIEKFGSINPVIIGKHGGKNNVNKSSFFLSKSDYVMVKQKDYYSMSDPTTTIKPVSNSFKEILSSSINFLKLSYNYIITIILLFDLIKQLFRLLLITM